MSKPQYIGKWASRQRNQCKASRRNKTLPDLGKSQSLNWDTSHSKTALRRLSGMFLYNILCNRKTALTRSVFPNGTPHWSRIDSPISPAVVSSHLATFRQFCRITQLIMKMQRCILTLRARDSLPKCLRRASRAASSKSFKVICEPGRVALPMCMSVTQSGHTCSQASANVIFGQSVRENWTR